MILQIFSPETLLQGAKADANGICVGSKTLAVCQGGHHRTDVLQAACRNLLRRNVFLERLRVDAAELACIAIRRSVWLVPEA